MTSTTRRLTCVRQKLFRGNGPRRFFVVTMFALFLFLMSQSLTVSWPNALAKPAGSPLVVKISACEPVFQNGKFAAGYVGAGYGNDKQDRSLMVRLAFETKSGETGEAAIKDAIQNTTKIELCWMSPTTGLNCPKDNWVVWDNTDGSKKPEDFPWRVYDDPRYTRPGLDVYLFKPLQDLVDWQDSTQARTAIIVRVNGGSGTLADQIDAGGACFNWSKLAEAQPADNSKFTIIGTEVGTQDPFNLATPLDLCVGGVGSKVDWIWNQGSFPNPNVLDPSGFNPCITKEQADYVRRVLVGMDDSQQERIQNQVAKREFAWKNGQDASGNFLPSYIMLGPHWAFGQANETGVFHINAFNIRSINTDPMLTATGQLTSGYASDLLRITAHEYFHELQHTWARERPQSDPHLWSTVFSEGMASSIEGTLCLKQYPSNALTPGQCVSSGKVLNALGMSTGVVSMFNNILVRPELDVATQPYVSEVFWRYIMEQFSYPVGSPAHPSGPASSIPHQDKVLNERDSDEGVDFMGLLFEQYGNTPSGVATLDALDQTLKNKLGRSLDDVVFDFHTAMYLKDYNDSDPRWRFEWIGDFNALTPLADSKPFDIPNDLYSTTPDRTVRAYRTLDSWGTCQPDPSFADFVPMCTKYGTGANPQPRPVLANNGSLASVQPVFLHPRGTTVVSIHPETPVSSAPPNIIKVSARIPLSATAPRFRIFRIDREVVSGKVKLNPKEICGVTSVCMLNKTQDGQQVLDRSVPVITGTDEILLLASGPGSASSSFNWSFGPDKPQVTIVEPIASLTAYIGHPQNPVEGRRPFLVKLIAQDTMGQNIQVQESDLKVSIPNCAAPSCQLTDEKDIGFLGLSGNNVLLVVNVPDSFYPSGGPPEGALDLEIEFKGVKDQKVGALLYNRNEKKQATMLVLDASGSMNDFGGSKLAAEKLVAKALIASMVPLSDTGVGPQAGIVTFNNDASTLKIGQDILVNVQKNNQADFNNLIDAIQPGGETSIGDGALEAQSNLAEAFDNLAAADRPDRQAMIVVSDGLNNQAYTPVDYYSAFEGGHQDGNGQWYLGPLGRENRRWANLPLPVVSTIAIGQDADGAELLQLARFGGGTMLYVPGPEQNGTQLLKLTVDFADAFGSAFNSVNDYDRIPIIPFKSSENLTKPHHAQVITGTAVAKIRVEPGASELRISLISGEQSFRQVHLLSPSGVLHNPNAFASEMRTAVFRIAGPEPGTWQLTNAAGVNLSIPSVFIEATVRSRVTLFTSADVTSLAGPPAKRLPAYDAGNWWGSDVYLRALLNENEALRGCETSAEITLPQSGKLLKVALRDDGKSGDALANDGTYGLRFTQTKEPGLYDVRFNIKCVSPISGATVERKANRTFELHRPNDLDHDGIFDLWEQRFGLNPNDAADAQVDKDGDGLTNLEEAKAGTNPFDSDTDGGGESDESEANAGRNPSCLKSDDRAASKPLLWGIPGNGRVFLQFGMTTKGIRIEINRASKIEGPFVLATSAAGKGQTSWSDTGLANDVPSCYRARTVKQGALSGWSPVVCVTPRADPDPPVLRARAVKDSVDAHKVTLILHVSDPPLLNDSAQFPFDRGVVSSGPGSIRISFVPSFKGVSWQPIQNIVAVKLSETGHSTLWVQVRDGAGNVSLPLAIGIEKASGPLSNNPFP